MSDQFLINVDSTSEEESSSESDGDTEEESEGYESPSEYSEPVGNDIETTEALERAARSIAPNGKVMDEAIDPSGHFTTDGMCWWGKKCTMEPYFKSSYVHVCEFCKKFVHSQCCMAHKLPEGRFACYQCHSKLSDASS